MSYEPIITKLVNKPDKLNVGSQGHVLTVDSEEDFGLKWAAVSVPDSDSSNGVFTNDIININDKSNDGSEISIEKGIIYFNVQDTGETHKRVINTSSVGQLVHLFFDTSGSTLQFDFGFGNLGIGSGTARYMTFTKSGQSASMVYIGNKWRVINTGAKCE